MRIISVFGRFPLISNSFKKNLSTINSIMKFNLCVSNNFIDISNNYSGKFLNYREISNNLDKFEIGAKKTDIIEEITETNTGKKTKIGKSYEIEKSNKTNKTNQIEKKTMSLNPSKEEKKNMEKNDINSIKNNQKNEIKKIKKSQINKIKKPKVVEEISGIFKNFI